MDRAIVERLKSAYQKWSDSKGGSIDTWVGMLADSVSFRSLANGAAGMEFSAPRCGPEEVRGYLERLVAEWEMLSFEMERFVAEGETVVAIGRCAWRNRQTGRSANTPKVDVWTFSDGKAVSFMEFYDTASAFAAARASA